MQIPWQDSWSLVVLMCTFKDIPFGFGWLDLATNNLHLGKPKTLQWKKVWTSVYICNIFIFIYHLWIYIYLFPSLWLIASKNDMCTNPTRTKVREWLYFTNLVDHVAFHTWSYRGGHRPFCTDSLLPWDGIAGVSSCTIHPWKFGDPQFTMVGCVMYFFKLNWGHETLPIDSITDKVYSL